MSDKVSILYPQFSAEVWAERYNITVTSKVCPNCKALIPLTIPFATKKWRGLLAEEHKCSGLFRLNVAVNIETRKDWDYLCKLLKSEEKANED